MDIANENFLKNSLVSRTIKGGMWTFLVRVMQQVFSFVRLIILARILAPDDFGLMGIAAVTMATLENFSRPGLRTALVQKKIDTEAYLNSAWTTMIIRGAILFTILYFIAPYVANFFEVSQAKLIIQVIGLAFLIQAVSNIAVIYFQKELEFNKLFIYHLSGILADFTVAISAALAFRNVWALVLGLLAGNIARLIASYLLHTYRPLLSLDWLKVKELLSFGKWIFGSSVLIFLITQGDNAFVGKLLGVSMLGFYQMAYRISNIPATEIANVISQVSFPVYSKLQDDISKLKEAFFKFLQISTFLSFPVAALICVLAPEFIRIFLGQKWMPMVSAMQVLAVASIARCISSASGYVFYGVGKPKTDTILQLVRLILLAGLIYTLTVRWGITGTSIAVCVSYFVSCLGFCYMAIRITEGETKSFAKILLLPFVNGTIVMVFLIKLKSIIVVGFKEFIILACFGILIYLSLAYLADKLFHYNIQSLIAKSLRSLKNA